jgi:hypothetical protein
MTGPIWGALGEFMTAEQLLAATRQAREAGYRRMDAYSPYPVEGLAAELGVKRSRIGSIVLIGALVGTAVGFWMQYYSMAIDYPVNVGGRPPNSWPAWAPVVFELAILVAAASAFLGMIFLNGLPQPHHPLFAVERFERASQDRFFLGIEATDPLFDELATVEFLRSLEPHGDIVLVTEGEPTESEAEEGSSVVDKENELAACPSESLQ